MSKLVKKFNQLFSFKNMDDECIKIRAVFDINSAKKPIEWRINLIDRYIPGTKDFLKKFDDKNKELELLYIIKDWTIKKTEECSTYLTSIGLPDNEQDKRRKYMESILNKGKYTPKPEEIKIRKSSIFSETSSITSDKKQSRRSSLTPSIK